MTTFAEAANQLEQSAWDAIFPIMGQAFTPGWRHIYMSTEKLIEAAGLAKTSDGPDEEASAGDGRTLAIYVFADLSYLIMEPGERIVEISEGVHASKKEAVDTAVRNIESIGMP